MRTCIGIMLAMFALVLVILLLMYFDNTIQF